MLLTKQLLAFRPNKLDWIFSIKTFIAGMLALFIAFELNLSYPIWAIGTVFVIANPYSGMVASKSLYRLLGTAFGAIFAVAVTPYLINTPWLFTFVLAVWVGICLYISLLDRTPRSYVVMLAGYTAVIICFNSIYYIDKISIFDMALGRFLEISIGVICSAVVTTTLMPMHIGPVVENRVKKTISDTQSLFDSIILRTDHHEKNYTQLMAHITRDTSDIHTMAVHLSYEKSKLKGMTKPLQELLHQVTMLVANLVAMSERLKQLDHIDMGYRENLTVLHRHVDAFLDDQHPILENELNHLPKHFDVEFDVILKHAPESQQVMLGSLKMDIRHFIQNVRAVRLIWQRMQQGDTSLPEQIVPLTTSYPSLHRDYGVAVRGGLSAFLTIMIASSIWILSGWKSGFMMAQMAAISACILTALDNPVPALKIFIRASIYAAIIIFIYAYGIFPHVHSFIELMLVLAPFLIFCLMLYLHPPLNGLGLPLIMGSIMGMNIQNRYFMDQVAFFDFSLGTVIGPIISVYIVHIVRAMSPEITVQRILALHYQAMREAVRMHYGANFRIHLRGMLDRIGVLNTKQVQSEKLSYDVNAALVESSAVIDFTRLQELAGKLSNESPVVAEIAQLQKYLEKWFSEKEKQQPADLTLHNVLQQLQNIQYDADSIGDEDIRHRLKISVNNIRNSVCHQQVKTVDMHDFADTNLGVSQ
ncbi:MULTISPECIES: FUSC family protein [unclassified Acinetobacter]|uniref:FUSC family protein n=1 Tax=unclassified Acinetobacter TaxID=196816 RepID=UPI002578907C|nr:MULTISPECIES: FUSC family protein [unclassified Acinetobacter]MDM1757935.1 FUSC family protein [Acinetobacter sp. 256-1]MDM1761350.1 FUSC family protein [Acinetobacter sp. 251-1]